MSAERLPDGPTRAEMTQLIRDTYPDAVVAEIESAVFFSLNEKHWPNFATIVWSDEFDMGTPSNLARPDVYRVNVGVDRETFTRLVGDAADPDYAALDAFIPNPVYAKQRWVSVLNPSHTTLRDTLMPLIAASHDRLARRR